MRARLYSTAPLRISGTPLTVTYGKYAWDSGQPPRIRKITALSKRSGYRNVPFALKKRKSRHSPRSHRVGNIESLLGAPAQIYIKDLYSRYFDGKYDRDSGQPPRIRKITALSKRTGYIEMRT